MNITVSVYVGQLVKKLSKACQKIDKKAKLQSVLCYVFWNAETQSFIATDGHILRVEKCDIDTLPAEFKNDLVLNYKADDVLEIIHDTEYPNVYNAIPRLADCTGTIQTPVASFDFSMLKRFNDTLTNTEYPVTMVYSKPLNNCWKCYQIRYVDRNNPEDISYMDFIGLIMPCKTASIETILNAAKSRNLL